MMLAALLLQAIIAEGTPQWRDPPECWDGPQSELNHCAYREFQEADQALNAQWKITLEYMRALDASEFVFEDGRQSYAEALLASQRAWLVFRDAHCVSEGYQARGGSMEPMLLSLCHAALTRERTEQLRQLAEYRN